jgi:hypothetical protein
MGQATEQLAIKKVQYIPVNGGYCNKLRFVFSKWPSNCRDSRHSSEHCHGVECACKMSTDVPVVRSW